MELFERVVYCKQQKQVGSFKVSKRALGKKKKMTTDKN